MFSRNSVEKGVKQDFAILHGIEKKNKVADDH